MKHERDAIRAKLFELGYDEAAADGVMERYDRQMAMMSHDPVIASKETGELPASPPSMPEPEPAPSSPPVRYQDQGHGPHISNPQPIPNPNRRGHPNVWRQFWNIPGGKGR